MIRLILDFIFVLLFLIFSILIWIGMWILSLFTHKKYDLASLRIVQWAFKVVAFIAGVKLEVHGEENVPKDKPVLYIANHTGIFDVVLCYSRTPRLTGFISKKEWKKIPLLNVWMNKLYCLFLDRDSIRDGMKMILQAIEYVKNGISIFIFPEGTRSRDGEFHEFHPGSFKIATKTGCPIIPIAITGSAGIFEDHKPFLKSQRVIITYGKPIVPGELSDEDKKGIAGYVHKELSKMLEENEKMMA